MATITLYNMEGKEVGSLPLPDAIFGVDYNEALVHQAIVAEEANKRQGTRNTLLRHDVRGGGRKPWKQKGTGRARAGTSRSPLWRGGGVVFGPHPRDYRKAFPVKMRRGAMRSVLSGKVSEGAVIGLEALHFEAIKTKSAVALLKALNLADTRRILIVIPDYDASLLRCTSNLPNVELRFAPNFSVRDALNAHKIVLVKDAVAKIESVWTPGGADEAGETTDTAVDVTADADGQTANETAEVTA
jgi:large subunit ribosomal protein L4